MQAPVQERLQQRNPGGTPNPAEPVARYTPVRSDAECGGQDRERVLEIGRSHLRQWGEPRLIRGLPAMLGTSSAVESPPSSYTNLSLSSSPVHQEYCANGYVGTVYERRGGNLVASFEDTGGKQEVEYPYISSALEPRPHFLKRSVFRTILQREGTDPSELGLQDYSDAHHIIKQDCLRRSGEGKPPLQRLLFLLPNRRNAEEEAAFLLGESSPDDHVLGVDRFYDHLPPTGSLGSRVYYLVAADLPTVATFTAQKARGALRSASGRIQEAIPDGLQEALHTVTKPLQRVNGNFRSLCVQAYGFYHNRAEIARESIKFAALGVGAAAVVVLGLFGLHRILPDSQDLQNLTDNIAEIS